MTTLPGNRNRPLPTSIQIGSAFAIFLARPAFAHGEQALIGLGADLVLLVISIVFVAVWRKPWFVKASFLVVLLGAMVAAEALPFCPNTVAETARMDTIQLVVCAVGLPVILGAVFLSGVGVYNALRVRRQGRLPI